MIGRNKDRVEPETETESVEPYRVVVYVNRRIAGSNPGEVKAVEWSDTWKSHLDAGNIKVVREDNEDTRVEYVPSPYTENAYDAGPED